MRRLSALLIALVASLALPAGALADPVESKRVSQKRDAVIKYWTAERMRTARPARRERKPLGKPGSAGGGKKASGAATEVPAPYTTFPTSTNGKVFFTDHGVNYVCSGTATSSANESVVWTAGHCVNEGGDGVTPGAFHTNWIFVPAYRDNTRPYGSWAARTLNTTSGWRDQSEFSYDLGAAAVSPSGGGSTLTDTAGGRSLAFNDNRDQRYNAFGYPAASPFNGQRLWSCDSPLYMSDRGSPQPMGIQCNMTGGSSGGGWVATDGRVHSVNSYGYSSLRNVMFGPYQGTVAQQLFTTASK